MRLEKFFEKFDELADAPNAVAKMRELVLQLAVQGSLVPHSAAEPAVPYTSIEDAMPINVSDVPANWRVVLLADAVNNRSGNSKLIKGKLFDAPAPHLFQGFSASGADVWCEDYEHEGEAIIISAVGARCGKAFKASGKWSAIANTNIIRLEPTLFDFDFAYLVLNAERFWVRGGSAQPFVKFPPSLDRHFAFPPLAEQKRIVAKVDEWMSLCDRLEAQQEERETQHIALARASLARFADAPTPANLSLLFHPSYPIPPAAIRKSILTLAVQGKLVPQDPNDEPVGELIGRLTSARDDIAKEQRVRLPKHIPQLSAEDWPCDLPESWQWNRIGHLAILIDYGTSQKADSDISKIPVYRMGNIVGGRLSNKNLKYVDPAIDDLPGLYLKSGDLLFNRTNSYELVGKTAIFDGEDDTATFASYLIRVRLPTAYLFSAFFSLAMNAPYFRQTQIEPEITQQCGQANFNGTKLASTIVPVPPLAEQRRIVSKVDQLMALVDQLETELTASHASGEKLMEAVVAELTTQD